MVFEAAGGNDDTVTETLIEDVAFVGHKGFPNNGVALEVLITLGLVTLCPSPTLTIFVNDLLLAACLDGSVRHVDCAGAYPTPSKA